MGEDRLDQILRIVIDGPPFEKWDPTKAVRLWWADKTRRVDASGYSAPRKRKDQSQSEDINWNLSDWENWLDSDSHSDKESESDLDLSP